MNKANDCLMICSYVCVKERVIPLIKTNYFIDKYGEKQLYFDLNLFLVVFNGQASINCMG